MQYDFKSLDRKKISELEVVKKDKQEEYHKIIEGKHILISNILSLQEMIKDEMALDSNL